MIYDFAVKACGTVYPPGEEVPEIKKVDEGNLTDSDSDNTDQKSENAEPGTGKASRRTQKSVWEKQE